MPTLPTIRLHSNMTMPQLISALNENLNLLQNQSQTIAIKDESGQTRILIGRLPDDTYGIVISKPTYDVTELFT